MISIIFLVCSLDNSECITIHPETFLNETIGCEAALMLALEPVRSKGGYIASYRCINWGDGA